MPAAAPSVSLALLDPEAARISQHHGRDAAKLQAFAQTFQITTAHQYANAQATLVQVSERIKLLEAQRKRAMAAVEVLLEPIKTPLAAYKWCKDYLKGEVLRWEREEQQRKDEALAKAALLQGTGRNEEMRALIVQGAAVTERVSGIRRHTSYSARVVDPSQVPAEYWIIDQQLLDRVARESKGTAVVPGVVFEANEGVSVRSS